MSDNVVPNAAPPRFPVLDVTERRTLTFDFSADLNLAAGEALVGPPQVAVSVDLGADPNPIGTILGGPVVISQTQVAMNVGNFNAASDTDYRYKITCATTNPAKVLALSGLLSVRFI